MLAGQPLITGASSSLTVTVNVQVELLAPSVAVQVTVVVPTAKVAPGFRSQVTATGPAQLSIAVGAVQVTTAPQRALSVPCVMLAGQPLITGASSSLTVIMNVQVELLT